MSVKWAAWQIARILIALQVCLLTFVLLVKKKRIRYATTSPVIQYLLHNYEILQFLNFTVSQLVELNKVWHSHSLSNEIPFNILCEYYESYFFNSYQITNISISDPGRTMNWLRLVEKNIVWTKKSELFSKLRRRVERNNIQRGKQCSSGLLWRLGTALIISVIQ